MDPWYSDILNNYLLLHTSQAANIFLRKLFLIHLDVEFVLNPIVKTPFWVGLWTKQPSFSSIFIFVSDMCFIIPVFQRYGTQRPKIDWYVTTRLDQNLLHKLGSLWNANYGSLFWQWCFFLLSELKLLSS